MTFAICTTFILLVSRTLLAQTGNDLSGQPDVGNELYRPQIHFTPQAHWMNDPNGLVYHNGVYHLFFQYYPGGSNWGPMHWGHATSKDLVHWKREPIALYPDTLGYIFSGSAVVDKENTSGFGAGGRAPLVAIFTHHDTAREHARRVDVENQSIAYSLDEGKTWTKYAGNPVIKNPGVRDFRDPKVMWYAPTRRWILTLAAQDRVFFYSSPDLKQWTKESEFGVGLGSHGGVWECPDLFALPAGSSSARGDSVWVLFVSIGWGGPNGGNGTQYFTGKFDGHTFTANDTAVKWVDHGRDDYAGVTWSNTGSRRIFLGWMVNGAYAGNVPTEIWRSGNTLPRELGIDKVNGRYFLVTKPVREMSVLEEGWKSFKESVKVEAPFSLQLSTGSVGSFKVVLSNDAGERAVVGFDKGAGQWYVDRSGSGKVDFHKDFAGRHVAPRIGQSKALSLTLVADVASLELFADEGLTVMSELVFPSKPYDRIEVMSEDGVVMKTLKVTKLKGIW